MPFAQSFLYNADIDYTLDLPLKDIDENNILKDLKETIAKEEILKGNKIYEEEK